MAKVEGHRGQRPKCKIAARSTSPSSKYLSTLILQVENNDKGKKREKGRKKKESETEGHNAYSSLRVSRKHPHNLCAPASTVERSLVGGLARQNERRSLNMSRFVNRERKKLTIKDMTSRYSIAAMALLLVIPAVAVSAYHIPNTISHFFWRADFPSQLLRSLLPLPFAKPSG